MRFFAVFSLSSSTSRRLWTSAFLILALTASACARKSSTQSDAQADEAVRKLRSGQTVDQLNRDKDGVRPPRVGAERAILISGEGDDWFLHLPQVRPEEGGLKEQLKLCPVVPKLSEDVPSEEQLAALQKLGTCIRESAKPANLALAALEYFKIYNRSIVQKPLSRMSDEELEELLDTASLAPIELLGKTDEEAPLRKKLRSSFSDRDLQEVRRLALRRYNALTQLEQAVFAMVDAHRGLFEKFATENNRWALILALRDTAGDATGKAVGPKVMEIAQKAKMQPPADLDSFPYAMLHPYALMSFIPDEGGEGKPLDPAYENPFQAVMNAVAQAGGSDALVKAQFGLYREFRESDNPKLPMHAAPAPNAARVVVVDTGIDFQSYPELATFLGNGQDGTIASGDFADGDENPFIPARGKFAHGTGTAATVLTTLAHDAPEVLLERKLDLAVWKVETAREALSTPAEGAARWGNRFAIQEAILQNAFASSNSVQPKIVSISAGFSLQVALENTGKTDAVLKAPWLWVMAAGNEGVAVGQGPVPSCLSDVPADKRNDARILCVGALKRGIIEDQIAGYSNYGERVDVYAYESYIDLCPNGTSCSTPAVSGAAAALAALYPELSPEQIKESIVEASEERVLSIHPDGAAPVTSPVAPELIRLMSLPGEKIIPAWLAPRGPVSVGTRPVHVFDPATMLPRALEIAKRKAAN